MLETCDEIEIVFYVKSFSLDFDKFSNFILGFFLAKLMSRPKNADNYRSYQLEIR